ncbi:MAG TPA: ATP-binding protein, partial [Acidimicrobiia bacterium]|nr:ATP-binding protein [Acidimicrobiia bacterium]
YTDGLVERRGEMLDAGLERLRTVALDAPRELESLADHLLDALLPEHGATDDVALLLVRSTRRPMALQVHVRARPEELARVRQRLRAWLHELDVDDADDVVVAVHEAAANVVEHAYGLGDGPLVIIGAREADAVRIEIRDTGTWHARSPRPQRGRGFSLMRSLMDSVDVRRAPSGTTVVLQRALRLPGSDPG